jgi:DNA-nicking Smr family endonuclease
MPHRVPIDGTLDLHTFRPEDVASVVSEYLEAAWAVELQEVRLIHGRGRGVQRANVHRVLAEHTRVEQFRDAPESHLGATLVTLTPAQ